MSEEGSCTPIELKKYNKITMYGKPCLESETTWGMFSMNVCMYVHMNI